MSRTTAHRRLSGLGTWRVALVLLALFATAGQQLVAQTHWHPGTVAAVSSSVSGSPADGPGTHDDCLWCQIASHAPAAAPPASMPVQLVLPVLTPSIPPGLHVVAVPAPAHAWQSRGPPAI